MERALKRGRKREKKRDRGGAREIYVWRERQREGGRERKREREKERERGGSETAAPFDNSVSWSFNAVICFPLLY